MKDIEFKHLKAFLAVVREGTFSKAASSLGISQVTVSERIAALERLLGTKVFRRGGRRVELTTAGETLLPHVYKIDADLQEAVGAIARVQSSTKTRLTVGTHESLSSYVVSPLLARMKQVWPQLNFNVRTGLCYEIRAMVKEGTVQAGIVLESGSERRISTDKRLQTEHIGESDLTLFAHPEHSLAGRNASLGSVANEEISLSDTAGSYHEALVKLQQNSGFPPLKLQSLGSVEGVKRYVLKEGGLGLLPTFVVHQNLDIGDIASVELDPPLPKLHLRAVFNEYQGHLPVVPKLLDELKVSIRQERILDSDFL